MSLHMLCQVPEKVFHNVISRSTKKRFKKKETKKKRTLALPSLVLLFRAIWISNKTHLVIETFCFAARVGFFVCLFFLLSLGTYDSLALFSSGFLCQLTQTSQRRKEENFLRK